VIDLQKASFDEFLDYTFTHREDGPLPEVEAARQIAHAERLFRDPSVAARFTPAQREKGFWFLASWTDPDFFSGQLWNHDVPAAARISCVNAMEVLYRDLFVADPHGQDAYMWFDLLLGGAPEGGCADCAPVRRALIGVLDDLLGIDPVAALHGLNHWGTAKERAAIIDAWLARAPAALLDGPAAGTVRATLREYASDCQAGRAQ
jgi:hypothetical protein